MGNILYDYFKEDLAKFHKSKSLKLFNELGFKKSRPIYFSFIDSLKMLRFTAQIRLFNNYSPRLITDNKIFKTRIDELCYCCFTEMNVIHLTNDCINDEDWRINYFGEVYSVVRMFVNIEGYNVKILMSYAKDIIKSNTK